MSNSEGRREGSLEAPTRHPLDWRSGEFYDEESLFEELERIFDICHGCRRCFNLCNSFPTLFDAVDESDTMEVDGVAKKITATSVTCATCRNARTSHRMSGMWTSRT
jgi:CO dehydrogenase/acetyl-CoA synthase alpha subunit